MTGILQGLEGIACHMDDILVHGVDQGKHDQRVRAVLQRLQSAGLTLNKKCEFSKTRITFLGHIITLRRPRQSASSRHLEISRNFSALMEWLTSCPSSFQNWQSSTSCYANYFAKNGSGSGTALKRMPSMPSKRHLYLHPSLHTMTLNVRPLWLQTLAKMV